MTSKWPQIPHSRRYENYYEDTREGPSSTIRLLLAAIKQREINNSKERDGNGLEESDAINKVIEKMIKQRRESISQYESGNRPDLAEKEQHEIEIN